MQVIMGVNMGGHPIHEAVELLNLAMELITDGWEVADIKLTFAFAPDIPMQANR
jgi:hypothetical protein